MKNQLISSTHELPDSPNGLMARGTTTKDDATATDLQKIVQQLDDELCQLLQRRSEVMKRIVLAKRTIVLLTTLFGERALNERVRGSLSRAARMRQGGLTKACRAVLMESNHPMTALEVHDHVRERAPALLTSHKAPVGSVTTILNRLARYGEVERITQGEKRAWQWITEALSEPDAQSDAGSRMRDPSWSNLTP